MQEKIAALFASLGLRARLQSGTDLKEHELGEGQALRNQANIALVLSEARLKPGAIYQSIGDVEEDVPRNVVFLRC